MFSKMTFTQSYLMNIIYVAALSLCGGAYMVSIWASRREPMHLFALGVIPSFYCLILPWLDEANIISSKVLLFYIAVLSFLASASCMILVLGFAFRALFEAGKLKLKAKRH